MGVGPSAHQTHQLRSGCWAQVRTVSDARCMLQMWQRCKSVVLGGRELKLDTANVVPGVGDETASPPDVSVTRADVKGAGLVAGGLKWMLERLQEGPLHVGQQADMHHGKVENTLSKFCCEHPAQRLAGHLWWELVWQAAAWLVGVSLQTSMCRQSAWRLLGHCQPGGPCTGVLGMNTCSPSSTVPAWGFWARMHLRVQHRCAQRAQVAQMGTPTCHSRRGKGGRAWCSSCCRHRGG